MNKLKQSAILLSGLTIIISLSSWGFFAHYKINRLAVFTLPMAMKSFYLSNIEYITQHAVSADKRRYVDSSEAPRHYLNADHFGKYPFKVIPTNWYDAALKYTADTLAKYGTLPWTIEYNYYSLVKAFQTHDTTRILNVSANLGHYIADAYVPLHLTSNYNGQLTGQTGIHALWESRIPELFYSNYKLYPGKVRYINNPIREAFKICHSSFQSIDTVLNQERIVNSRFVPSKKYESVLRGKKHVVEYTISYTKQYNKLLGGMVERKMRSAILSVASFWYSAWVDAGQPDLYKLEKNPLKRSALKTLKQEEKEFKTKKNYSK